MSKDKPDPRTPTGRALVDGKLVYSGTMAQIVRTIEEEAIHMFVKEKGK